MTDDRAEIQALLGAARARNIIIVGETGPVDVGIGVARDCGPEPQIVVNVINPRRPRGDRIQVFYTLPEARALATRLGRMVHGGQRRIPVRLDCGCGCHRYFQADVPKVWAREVVVELRVALREATDN